MLRLLKLLASLAVCAAVAVGVAVRLDELYRESHDEATAEAGTPEDQQLFQDLLAAELLQPRADGGLDRVPRDWLLRQEVAAADSDAAADAEADEEADEELAERARELLATRRRLLGVLDQSAVGSIVGRHIELWNETRRIAAIRDNRARADEAPSAWSAEGMTGRPLASGALVPETFGFLHEGVLRPGFSDWLSVAGSTSAVTFRSRLQSQDGGTLTVQVVGTPIRIPTGAHVRVLSGPEQDDCPEPPVAHVVTVPVAAARTVPLELTVLPSLNCASRIHGLAIRRDPPQDEEPARYRFRPVKRSRPAGRFAIVSRDGEPLTDPVAGGASDLAEQLRLTPIVGTGGGDSFSISGLLAATKLPLEGLEVTLTIDSKIQALAQEAVSWGITRFGNDTWAGERKSALVILDADDGAILAAAGHPTIPPGLADWDLPSFSAAFPLRDPSTILAWEVIDKHNTPGSTFKPVTALSAMMETDPEIQAAIGPILRGLDSGPLRAATGLSLGSSSFIAYRGAKPVPNFGGATLGRYVGRPSRDARCIADDPEAQEKVRNQARGFGLRHATQFSLNAWYAAIALKIERARIDEFAKRAEVQDGERIPAPEMTLTRTARFLGVDDRERLDLASNVPASAGLHRYSGEAHDVLYPQLARSTLAGMAYNKDDWGARPLVMYTAALNGIGQTVSASPLQMALVASAIATGQRVRPYLISSWGGEPLPAPAQEPLPVDPELLGLLRDGMKAVPEVGTAPRAFPRPLACRIYGKTGTAEIDAARSYNSGWFIGWQEPIHPDERRLAFACMTTHATGGYRFGGTACAPVVSRVLQALEPQPDGESEGES